MACIFEFELYFVRCNMVTVSPSLVTVSPSRIIIIIAFPGEVSLNVFSLLCAGLDKC